MSQDFEPLCDAIGYSFKDQNLLKHALCHRSVGDLNNERLEFLGDAILSAIVAETLFRQHPHALEGELSRMRSLLVSGERLAELAKELNLGNYLQLGPGELKSGGRERVSILADALEALLGAIFLDANMETCRLCIQKWYGRRLGEISETDSAKDPKSLLQEWAQSHKFPLPTYTYTATGRPHEQIFVVTCEVIGLPHRAIGSSSSRRKAEQMAAKNYLDLIQ